MIFSELMRFGFVPMNLEFFSDTGEGEGTPAEDVKVEEKEELDENVLFSEFDRKSPLIHGGMVDEDEDPVPMNFDDDSSPFDKDKPEPDEPETSNAPAPSPPPAPAPFRVLKYGGREIPVASQEEYDRFATAGLEAAALRQQIAPYVPYLIEVERDPELAQQVVSMIEARRRGAVPTTQPVAEEPEPEQGDDETFDDYEKRLKAWNAQRQAKLVEENVRRVLEQREADARNQRMTAMKQEVARLAMADPRLNEVLPILANYPKPLQEAMNSDPATFMVEYDKACRLLGREGYFGAPIMPNLPSSVPGNQNPAPQPQKGGDTVNSAPGGRTVLKGRSVPFAEKGGVGTTSRSGSGLPDFKNMSDKDFEKVLAKVRSNGM